jgi:hypothetical protein
LALSFAGWSCGAEEEEPPPPVTDELAPDRVEITGGVLPGSRISGPTTLAAVAEDNSGRVARVSFYLGAQLACADSQERASGATFSCVWDGRAPEGTQELVALAEDATGNITPSLPIAFTVGPNVPPTISQTVASPDTLNEGQDTTLLATANDHPGEGLSFSWEQVSPLSPVGTFTGADTATPTWTAPLISSTRTFTLQVTVSDDKGGRTQRTVNVQVVNVPAANRPPVVADAISAPATVLAGDFADLSIGATDPDGDPLTYTWRGPLNGPGIFTQLTAASTRWRSPDISTATDFTLQVTVSDGAASVTRLSTVRVTVPTYASHIQPIWNDVCTSCHDSTSPTGGLNLLPGVSRANLVGVNGTNRCGGTTAIPRVVANQPDSSLLVRKISGATCGTRMPSGNTNYFVDNPGLITRIRSWIRAGALNN